MRIAPPPVYSPGRLVVAAALAGLAASAAAQPVGWSPYRDSAPAGPPRPIAPASEPTGPKAILIRNPDPSRGAPPYALIDQYGQVQRLVESSRGVDLDRFVGQQVRVRRDAGGTLLASELDLRVDDAGGRRGEPEFRSPGRSRGARLAAAEFDASPTEAGPDRAGTIDLDAIDLDRVIDESAAEERAAGDLPTPRSRGGRLEPIPADSDAPMLHDGAPEAIGHRHMHGGEYVVDEGEYLGADYGHDVVAPSCDCASCRTRRGPSRWSLCSTCGMNQAWCGPSCKPASRRGLYGRFEYLLWWFDGMNTPPLVTTNDQGALPDLATPGTRVLYGGQDVLDGARNGLRFTIGAWLDDNRDLAIEGDALFFEAESDFYSAGDTTGATVLGRPFYNLSPVANNTTTILPPEDDAELVSYPGLVGGTVGVQARSQFDTFGVRLRTGLCCCDIGGGGCGCSECGGRGGLGGWNPLAGRRGISRADFVVGYRYARLRESLVINESLRQVTTAANPATFAITDQFRTNNEFNGLDFGFLYDWQVDRLGLELTSRVALGNTHQRVRIAGGTTVGSGTNSTTYNGGLLALDSNSGDFSRSRFGMLPELSARMTYRVTPRLRLLAGYTVMYWANVVRPGDQIDLDVDPRLLPPATTTAIASSHPQFAFHETGLWMHGFNFGVDYMY